MDEKQAEQSMQLILHSGDGRSTIIEGIRQMTKDGDVEKAREAIKKGSEEIGKAHNLQTEMMTAEMNGTPYEKSILLIHAQDHFMTALAVRDMASLMVDMFEALQKAKKEG
jgi:PTS system cellobiose-specific IIA component